MRILSITFALSLIGATGCVDELTIDESQENASDDADPSNPDQTGDLPTDNKCNTPHGDTPGGTDTVSLDSRDGRVPGPSRKKADGSCF